MRPLFLILAALISACGGGGGGGSQPASIPQPAPAPEPEPEPILSVGLEPAFINLEFNSPLFMLQAPTDDDHWYLVERAGRVWRFANDDDTTSMSLVVDITSQVSSDGEGGLLGMALHPDFASNGRAFLSYTAPLAPLESRVSEFTSFDAGLTLAADSERIALTILQDFSNHNGGQVSFGPDGYLYLAMGDGGSGNDPLMRAQDTTNLLGAMIRIDVDSGEPYGIPPGNPNAGNPLCIQGFGSAPCPEIFAWGLRNPWRFSFDRVTGELWAADVGQNDREEIDLIEVAGNYGWPTKEGSICNPNLFPEDCVTVGFIDPVAEYEHDLGRSVTGGYVYRGRNIPALEGDYVFGDFVTGRIWRLAGQELALDEMVATELLIASFAEGNDGELFVLDIGGGLYRLVNTAP